jgi:hypothetical protein
MPRARNARSLTAKSVVNTTENSSISTGEHVKRVPGVPGGLCHGGALVSRHSAARPLSHGPSVTYAVSL